MPLRARPELTTLFGPGSRPFGTRTPSGMYYTKTRRPFDTLVLFRTKQLARRPFSRCPFNTPFPLPSSFVSSSLFPHHSIPFLCPATPYPFAHEKETAARLPALPVVCLGHGYPGQPAHARICIRLRPKRPRPPRPTPAPTSPRAP